MFTERYEAHSVITNHSALWKKSAISEDHFRAIKTSSQHAFLNICPDADIAEHEVLYGWNGRKRAEKLYNGVQNCSCLIIPESECMV